MDFTTLLTPENLAGAVAFIVKPLLLLLACKVVITLVLRASKNLFNKSKFDKGIQTFSMSAIRIVLWVLAVIMIAGAFGVDTASLVTVLGVASLALSLAVQGIFTNIFSGIVILLTKPFSVGDYVEACGISGTIKSIEIMRTVLNTPDNKVIIVPNSDIVASQIVNYSTKEHRRVELTFTASYDNSTEEVKAAIMEVLDANDKIVELEGKEKFIALKAYNANDIEYVVRFWVNNSDYWATYFEVNEAVRESYKKHGIEFSYPHVIVHNAK